MDKKLDNCCNNLDGMNVIDVAVFVTDDPFKKQQPLTSIIVQESVGSLQLTSFSLNYNT